jgi:S1-C subfamily serine protease
MQQGDFVRVLGSIAVAGIGAGLALGGAALTGNLGGATTIEQFTAAAVVPSSRPPRANGSLTVQQIYDLDAPGVVQIGDATASTSAPLGSGFVIDKAGHIVTSNLVLGNANDVSVSFSGSTRLHARVVGKDPASDVALLQVDAHSRSLSPLPLGDSDQVEVGDPVVAIGNTFDTSRTATVGIVSAVPRAIDGPSLGSATHSIQTDAIINSGNTGGPLINTRGQVIGISSELRAGAETGGAAGIGFAIPIDLVKSVVAQLLQTGKVEHAFLGVDAVAVTPSLSRTFNLPSTSGLLVQGITAGSAAQYAGLRAGRTSVVVAGESYRIGGDIIIAVDGAPVTSTAQLRNAIEGKKPGDRLALELWRGGRKETVHVTLGRPPG